MLLKIWIYVYSYVANLMKSLKLTIPNECKSRCANLEVAT